VFLKGLEYFKENMISFLRGSKRSVDGFDWIYMDCNGWRGVLR